MLFSFFFLVVVSRINTAAVQYKMIVEGYLFMLIGLE